MHGQRLQRQAQGGPSPSPSPSPGPGPGPSPSPSPIPNQAEQLRFAYYEAPLLLNLSVVDDHLSPNRNLSRNLSRSAPPLAPLGGGTLLSIHGEHLLGLAANASANAANASNASSNASASTSSSSDGSDVPAARAPRLLVAFGEAIIPATLTSPTELRCVAPNAAATGAAAAELRLDFGLRTGAPPEFGWSARPPRPEWSPHANGGAWPHASIVLQGVARQAEGELILMSEPRRRVSGSAWLMPYVPHPALTHFELEVELLMAGGFGADGLSLVYAPPPAGLAEAGRSSAAAAPVAAVFGATQHSAAVAAAEAAAAAEASASSPIAAAVRAAAAAASSAAAAAAAAEGEAGVPVAYAADEALRPFGELGASGEEEGGLPVGLTLRLRTSTQPTPSHHRIELLLDGVVLASARVAPVLRAASWSALRL